MWWWIGLGVACALFLLYVAYSSGHLKRWMEGGEGISSSDMPTPHSDDGDKS